MFRKHRRCTGEQQGIRHRAVDGCDTGGNRGRLSSLPWPLKHHIIILFLQRLLLWLKHAQAQPVWICSPFIPAPKSRMPLAAFRCSCCSAVGLAQVKQYKYLSGSLGEQWAQGGWSCWIRKGSV